MFIDDELKGSLPADHYPYEIRKINILSSLRNHLNSTSLASQLSAHELIGTNDDQQSKLIEQPAGKPAGGGGGFSVIFMPSRSSKCKSRPPNQRALTAPTTTVNRLPTIRSNSVSNDVLVDHLAEPASRSNDSPPTSSNESPLNIANKDASTANNPLVQGYHLMHETSI